MNEEILIALGYDMQRIISGQKRVMHLQEMGWRDQEAKQFALFQAGLKKQEAAQMASDRRRLELMDQMRTRHEAQMARHEARVAKFQKDLAAARQGGNAVNLAAGAAGEAGAGGGGHHAGVLSEALVLARETARGNFTRIPGSLSIIIQRMGALGRVIGFLTNPVTMATGVLLGLGYAAQRIGGNAQQVLVNSAGLGFTTSGYQGLMQAAGREKGGAEGAQAGLEHLNERIGEARAGSAEVYQNFRKWGIAIDDANGNALTGQKIYTEILSKIEATTDPAKRLALITDMFGEAGLKFQKTLQEGQSGFEDSQRGQPNSRNLAGLSAVAQILGGSVNGSSGLFAAGGSLAKGGWHVAQDFLGSVANVALDSGFAKAGVYLGNAMTAVASHPFKTFGDIFANRHPFAMGEGSANIGDAYERGRKIDAKEAALVANGTIHGRRGSAPDDFRRAFLSGKERLAEAQAALDDRGKVSLAEGADMARKMTGDVLPQMHTVSARMRTMLKIQDLDARANVDFLKGDDAGMKRDQGLADQMRKANPWMMRGDTDPTAKLVNAVNEIKLTMAPLVEMAKKFNMDANGE